MKRNYANITKVFLLFFAMGIMLHSFLPHDHHYTLQCETTHNENHHDKSPFHCHYLNNVLHKSPAGNMQMKLLKKVKRFDAEVLSSNVFTAIHVALDFYLNRTTTFPALNLSPCIYPVRGSPLC